jgi:hypothetical protein
MTLCIVVEVAMFASLIAVMVTVRGFAMVMMTNSGDNKYDVSITL